MKFGQRLAEALGRELPGAQVARLEAHFDLLIRWNKRLNLTAIREEAEIIERHFAESVWLGGLLPSGATEVADVGSGGGFPGVPVAIIRPELQVILVESHRRKAVFLREACRDLVNVEVVDRRLEETGREFEWIVSRGVNWIEFGRGLASFCRNAALLLGREDAETLQARGDFAWQDRLAAPWGRERVALIGQRRST